MTATSGPGLSLMAELVGLAGMAEIPAVIVDAQRSGPSTGMPTKTEQSDLNHALYGGHGEAPRVVMAPTSVDDCFHIIVDAFNAAEKYQVPGDRAVGPVAFAPPRDDRRGPTSTSREVDDARPDAPNGGAETNGSYQRYEIRDDGVSPMAVPGSPGAYVSTGHRARRGRQPALRAGAAHGDDVQALPQARTRSPTTRVASRSPAPSRPTSASSAGARPRAPRSRRRAICLDRGLKVSTCYPRVLAPLPVERIREWAQGMKRVIVPELNVTGQFARLVRADVGIEVESVHQGDRPAVHGGADRRLHHRRHACPPTTSGVWVPGMTGEARVG